MSSLTSNGLRSLNIRGVNLVSCSRFVLLPIYNPFEERIFRERGLVVGDRLILEGIVERGGEIAG